MTGIFHILVHQGMSATPTKSKPGGRMSAQESLARSMQPTASNHDPSCPVFRHTPIEYCTCPVWPTLLAAAGRLLANPEEDHHSTWLTEDRKMQRIATIRRIANCVERTDHQFDRNIMVMILHDLANRERDNEWSDLYD